MSRIAYVNGAYVPLAAARVSIQDRGFQFGDAVYEVWPVRGGRLFDTEEHLARLKRSLQELRIATPMSDASLMVIVREMMRRNRVRDGIVYLQISRGAATRDHTFPSPAVKPTLILTAKNLDQRAIARRSRSGVKVITLPENRWARRDIKSVNLIPNVMARQQAKEAGAFEAWYVDAEGFVTEGTSSSAFIVDTEGRIRTRGLSNDLLHGVTRVALLRIARERQMAVIEAPFTLGDVKTAREAFISAASNPATPVVAVDDQMIGDGAPGPITRALQAAYLGA